MTFVYSPLADGAFSERRMAEVLGTALHAGYTRESILDGLGMQVEVTRYPEYPLQRVVQEEFEGVVEGRLMSETGAVAPILRAVWETLKSGGQPSAFERVLSSLHGDFLVLLRSREDGRFILFNDRLGRLPTYYYQDGPRIILSREPGVVASLGERRSLDAVGTTEYLVFGYTWGDRTLLDGVRRLPPSSWIMGGAGAPVTFHRAPERNFTAKSRGELTIEKNAGVLSDLLVAASRAQTGTNNVLSLSGGLDSRAVGAALNRAGSPFVAATYLDAPGRAGRDVDVAGQVAEALGAEWRLCRLQPPTASDYEDLLSFRYGANNLRMAFILPFFRWMREELGADLTQHTGDGGMWLKPAVTPKTRLADAAAVVDQLMNRQSIFSVAEASELTGQPSGHLRDRLVARVEDLPEAEAVDRVTHLLVYERGVNLNFEAEDRNRYYFWSSTPFYDWRFFVEAMACPEHQKAYHRLYAAVLSHLDPLVARISRPNFGGAITDRRYRLFRQVQAHLGLMPDIAKAVRRFRKRRPPRPEPWKLQAIRSKGLAGAGESVWASRLVPWLAAREQTLTPNQANALLTIISLAELLERGTASFDGAPSSAHGARSE